MKGSRSLLFSVVGGKVEGYLFRPSYQFPEGKPMPPKFFNCRNNAKRVRGLLEQANREKVKLSITGLCRGLDGPGSSLDIPEFQRRLTDRSARQIDMYPSTLTVASTFTTKLTVEAAENPNAIEYVAPDYGRSPLPMSDQKSPPDSLYVLSGLFDPYVVEGPVVLTEDGKTKKGMKDAPAYVLSNLFGLKGVRLRVEAISPMALAGGMESSAVFLTGLIAAASIMSAAFLSQADIFSLAVKLENHELGGLTGGQGHLCATLGGIHHHIWLLGLTNSFSAFSIPILTSDQQIATMEDHFLLVQAGKEFKDGTAVTSRVAALTNGMWTDLLRDSDPVALPLHQSKVAIAANYVAALSSGDYTGVVECVNRYVDIRDTITRRWLQLAIDAKEGLPNLPAHAQRYAQKAFGPENVHFEPVRQLYASQGRSLRDVSLYSFGPAAAIIQEGRKQGIAVMPLGAGGPGANLIAISSQGKAHVRSFVESLKMEELSEDGVRKIMRGTGTLRGFMPLKIGTTSMQYEGFESQGMFQPAWPMKLYGRFEDLVTRF